MPAAAAALPDDLRTTLVRLRRRPAVAQRHRRGRLRDDHPAAPRDVRAGDGADRARRDPDRPARARRGAPGDRAGPGARHRRHRRRERRALHAERRLRAVSRHRDRAPTCSATSPRPCSASSSTASTAACARSPPRSCRAVEGRHLLMSTSVAVQDQLRYFDATGALPDPELGDQVHLTVQNVSANKLDYYVETALTVTGDRTAGRAGRAGGRPSPCATARRRSHASRAYVFGPFNDAQEAGVYRGRREPLPPGRARRSPASRGPRRATHRRRRPRTAGPSSATPSTSPPGPSPPWSCGISLPPRRGEYQLLAVPSPRVLPTALRVDVATEAGKVAGSVELTRTWRFRPAHPPSPAGLVG